MKTAIKCSMCDGTGVFVNLYHPLPRSMGRGMYTCSKCNGFGEQLIRPPVARCPKCGNQDCVNVSTDPTWARCPAAA